MDLVISFANEAQKKFYYATERNQCFSGGFNNGKTWAGCLKAITLLATFPKYRYVIARQVRSDLMKTTYQTFFKICPKEFIESQNLQEGYTYFKNGSRVDWIHLDKVDESTLRGLEINGILVDQAEETDEKTFDILDSRLGRWDEAKVPKELLNKFPDWPKNPYTGKYIVPSYHSLLCNPDTQFHYIYRKFHPDSLERDPNSFFVEGEWDPSLGSEETYRQALLRGDEWVAKYVKGQWGISNAQIHRIPPESLLDYDESFLQEIKKKGTLYRVLDHGDASPTCCLWVAYFRGVYIFYREYYVPNRVISEHRKNINELSRNEYYSGNFADPTIFRKSGQKDGGFWSVADEYCTGDLKSPPLFWTPADNNEFATRNRINELLKPSEKYENPITGHSGPGIYFIKRSDKYPEGIFHAINELSSQRRELLGYIDGKAIYSDNREKSIADHAYDCIRYFIAMHGIGVREYRKQPAPNSFKWYQTLIKRQKAQWL